MQSHNYSVQNSLNWFNQFEELLEYKKQFGHCNVPSKYENQTLANWVKTQRSYFKHLKLPEERINMLNSIGFNWCLSKDSFWIDKFEELKIYKSKHEDCNVPVKDDKNQPLANWVQRQRSQFKYSKMSEERIKMLNSIGFNWSISKDSFWIDKFEELKLYKSKHGDCNVPARYNKNQPLASWVQKQRFQFKHSTLSRERINMLNSIGFIWCVKKPGLWIDKFEELKLYKSKHGDCNVPWNYDENQQLATWVQKQRFQFKHSKMSEERINMLNNIGFTWYVSKNSFWIDKFEELKQYKLKHGDCNVPRIYEENQQLATWVQTQRSQCKNSKLSEESIKISKKRILMLNGIGFSWTATKRIDKPRQFKNHEQIVIETSYQDSKEKEKHSVGKEQKAIKKSYQDLKERKDLEEYHEQIAIEPSYQDQQEKETTTEEEGEMPFKRSLQDRIQVLCKISIMFQEQKDAIHANMKRRKHSA